MNQSRCKHQLNSIKLKGTYFNIINKVVMGLGAVDYPLEVATELVEESMSHLDSM